MNKNFRLVGIILILGIVFISCNQKKELKNKVKSKNESIITKLTGPYLGQKLPGKTPELFAPDILRTEYDDRGTPTFSPDMKEVYWSVSFTYGAPEVILWMKRVNNEWTKPEVAPFSGKYSDGSPCLSPDNKRIFFDSTRPLNGNGDPKDKDIWYIERTESGWGKPVNAGKMVNTDKMESNPSVSKSGTLYFSSIFKGYPFGIGIFKSSLVNMEYTKRKFLDEKINSKKGFDWSLFIDPDEKYVVFCSGRDGQEMDDMYCSFKNEDGSWTDPVKFDLPVNSKSNDRFPRISPDGKFLFFARTSGDFKRYFKTQQSLTQLKDRYKKTGDDFYWVDARVIKELKPRDLK